VSRFCLDTSAYSHFKRGDPQVVHLIDRADWLGVPAVVLGELRAGFMQGGRAGRNEAELEAFLDHPVVELLVVDDAVARVYAEILVDLRRAGRPLPTNDVWVAATAAGAGAPVLTYDPHFRSIRRAGSLVLRFGDLEPPAST
jgi:predicted nucleic acid-binding protein